MAAVGSLVFCMDCGNLLRSKGVAKSELPCECCERTNIGELCRVANATHRG